MPLRVIFAWPFVEQYVVHAYYPPAPQVDHLLVPQVASEQYLIIAMLERLEVKLGRTQAHLPGVERLQLIGRHEEGALPQARTRHEALHMEDGQFVSVGRVDMRDEIAYASDRVAARGSYSLADQV
jgi:hypothetical protein